MKLPPLEWDDMHALGVAVGATMEAVGSGIAITPTPGRLVRALVSELFVRPAPEDRASYLRHVRDLLLSLTDWTQAADSPLSETQRAAWATYRQSLRDLPSVYGGEGPIPWPDAPA